MKYFLKIFLVLLLTAVLLPLKAGQAFDLPNAEFPKTVNLYWKTPITHEEAKKLAKYDLIALDMQAQSESAEEIRYIRDLNPQIIILAYTSANEIPKERLKEVEPQGFGLWHDLVAGLDPTWQLQTYNGRKISWWPGNVSMNLYVKNSKNQSYGDYLVSFYQNQVLSTNLWDGLLLDNVWQNVSWVDSNIDIDGDGQPDSSNKIDSLWQKGYSDFFDKLRKKFGSKYLILGNGDGLYQDKINGRMFEGFPEYWEGGWTGSMKKYRDVNYSGYGPRVNIINSDSNDSGEVDDYQTMRFGLASTLLFDGYYTYNFGPFLREHFWWYDEFDTKLGKPKTQPFNLLDKKNQNFQPGVWQRDFTNGVVLVNSTDQVQTLKFDSEYEKIRGSQDQTVNDGKITNQLVLQPNDGVIVLRPIDEIDNQIFTNGSFARVFNGEGKNIRTGFFAYASDFSGSNKIAFKDLNDDGEKETLVASNNKIEIYSSANVKLKTFYPYGTAYSDGLSVAVEDLNNDNNQEIITGPERGGSNLVKIFSWNGRVINSGFYAYNRNWKKLGVNVAAGDINGDGQKEIVVGAGLGGGPHVKIFNKNGKLLSAGFFAYAKTNSGGVNVAVGDVDGDKVAEIITGAGFGAAPQVKIFDAQGQLINSWLAYQAQEREGVKVVASDLDGNKKSEILALTVNVFTTSFIEQNKNIEYSSEKK